MWANGISALQSDSYRMSEGLRTLRRGYSVKSTLKKVGNPILSCAGLKCTQMMHNKKHRQMPVLFT